jgi:hypothetical protein
VDVRLLRVGAISRGSSRPNRRVALDLHPGGADKLRNGLGELVALGWVAVEHDVDTGISTITATPPKDALVIA